MVYTSHDNETEYTHCFIMHTFYWHTRHWRSGLLFYEDSCTMRRRVPRDVYSIFTFERLRHLHLGNFKLLNSFLLYYLPSEVLLTDSYIRSSREDTYVDDARFEHYFFEYPTPLFHRLIDFRSSRYTCRLL